MTVHLLIERTKEFEKLSQKEQIKRMAYFFCLTNNIEEFSTKNIREEFQVQKLSVPSGLASLIPQLAKSKPPVFIKNKNGYLLHRTAKKQLDAIYVNIHEVEVSDKLRDLIPKVKSKEQQSFLDEVIKCFEIKAFRSSMIMCWLLTMDVLYEFVLTSNNISVFNNSIQTHGKYRKVAIRNKDDFSELKESDFIELLRVSKFITNDIRKILDDKLGQRNSSAHPNTICFDELKTMSFIKDLLINVIEKYQ